RTGRLLDPKTGTLSMTIQAMLRGGTRPITLVPIYIGYEHVMELLIQIMSGEELGDIEAIFHEGACSSTTEWDGKYMMDNNYQYS
ncbi:hypothetical protein MJM95_27425, partial [Salmonella enterica subsp. enterica serovar Anatum]|nr:hypothetical protein [Salmonella enterica subsp. enterica serovar Anatum]